MSEKTAGIDPEYGVRKRNMFSVMTILVPILLQGNIDKINEEFISAFDKNELQQFFNGETNGEKE